jgi:hypothetical protein
VLAPCLIGISDNVSMVAARVISTTHQPEFEPFLLEALPNLRGMALRWALEALGKLRSPAGLAYLLKETPAEVLKYSSLDQYHKSLGVIEALGYYPDEPARRFLWKAFESYTRSDSVSAELIASLLYFPETDAIPRIAARLPRLRLEADLAGTNAIHGIARACDVFILYDYLIYDLPENGLEALGNLFDWLDADPPVGDKLVYQFSRKNWRRISFLLPALLQEIESQAAEKGEDWSDLAGLAGAEQESYRWRKTLAFHWLQELAQKPGRWEAMRDEVSCLALALYGQFVTILPEPEISAELSPGQRKARLFEHLSQPSWQVMPTVIDQIVALGAQAIPGLVAIIQKPAGYWSLSRAMKALARIAWDFPQAAELALPVVLGELSEDAGDEICETAAEIMQAVGPAAVPIAVKSLERENSTYQIYVTGTLADIPAEASFRALLAYCQRHPDDRFAVESLGFMCHPRALPFLRRLYLQKPEAWLAEACFLTACSNKIDDPLLPEWRTQFEESQQFAANLFDEWSGKRIRAEDQPSNVGQGEAADRAPAEQSPPEEQPPQKRSRRSRRKKK